ncbi:DUF485 domain-containing protein [Streptomyces sp. NPDC006992]|uniref:DUF485 domain-containing protein n=1 Tax=unclassified Streptomyces TaxID=2593676 RepID=UPI0033DC33A2
MRAFWGMRIDDPWYDVLATGGAEVHSTPVGTPPQWTGPPPPQREPVPSAVYGVYPTVQRSAAFQQVRRRYRRFALPVSAAFLLWYLGYVVLAVCAPGLMARSVAGVLNVGMVAGLAQFATTFLLTWLYTRHARLRRDRLALELRWETQDMARSAVAAAGSGGAATGTIGEAAR